MRHFRMIPEAGRLCGAAGWFYNFGWDPIADRFYVSRMGHPTFIFAAKKALPPSGLRFLGL